MEGRKHPPPPVRQRWRAWPLNSDDSIGPKWALEPGAELERIFNDQEAGNGVILTGDGQILRIDLQKAQIQPLFQNPDHALYYAKVVDLCPYPAVSGSFVVILDSGRACVVDVKEEKVLSHLTNSGLKNWMECEEKNEMSVDPLAFGAAATYVSGASGSDHLILVDDSHQAWSTGKGPQTGLISEFKHHHDVRTVLSRIDFFQGVRILMLAAGQDFNVAIIEKEPDHGVEPPPPPSQSPMSTSMTTISGSQPHSCPLGLPLEEGAIIPKSGCDEVDGANRQTAPTQFVNYVSSMSQSMVSKLSKSLSIEGGLSKVVGTTTATTTTLSMSSGSSDTLSVTKCHRRTGSSVSNTALMSSSPPDEHNVFQNEVWVWGKGVRGQVGQGDMLDRLQPCAVAKLSGCGVIKVACGHSHSIALTITGHVLGWGHNSHGQACPDCTLAVCPFPKDIQLPQDELARDIAAWKNTTVVLCDSGNVFVFGEKAGESRQLWHVSGHQDDPEKKIRKVHLLDDHVFVSLVESCDGLIAMKMLEKQYLNRLRDIIVNVLIPLCKFQNNQTIAKLQSSSRMLMRHVSSSVQQSWELLGDQDIDRHPLIADVDVFCDLMTVYIRNVCDCFVADYLDTPSPDPASTLMKNITRIVTEMCHGPLLDHLHSQGIFFRLQHLLFYPSDVLPDFIKCLENLSEGLPDSAATKRKVDKSKTRLKHLWKSLENERKLMRETREFWAMEGDRFASLKTPSRRLILDSMNKTIGVANASSFSKHRFVLLNDVLVHRGYASFDAHPLNTVWIDTNRPLTRSTDTMSGNGVIPDRHDISLIMPEDTLLLVAGSAETKSIWLSNLQRCINDILSTERRRRKHHDESGNYHDEVIDRSGGIKTPPMIRSTSFTFRKINGPLRNAEYSGAWVQGKAHGYGTIKWCDGSKFFTGQMKKNLKHGPGRMECVDLRTGERTVYEGYWKNDQMDGPGIVHFHNGDVYKGSLKNGQPHGQGVFKQGKFTPGSGGAASVYVGEFQNGLKDGYGVFDDIVTGEKFMGNWSNDVKFGPGCVITSDGIYNEGNFVNGKMVGKGLAIFEDDAVYEGNFADAGIFSGHGTLHASNGDKMIGHFDGNYVEGMKFNGIIHRRKVTSPCLETLKNSGHGDDLFMEGKIGTYAVPAKDKWRTIFRQYKSMLFPLEKKASSFSAASEAWDLLAIQINQNKNDALTKERTMNNKAYNNSSGNDGEETTTQSSIMNGSFQEASSGLSTLEALEGLEMIPDYEQKELTVQHLDQITCYLDKAFASPFHPFANLLTTLCDCFAATYGGVRVHPRLLSHAVQELFAMVREVYTMISTLFPSLPAFGDHLSLNSAGSDDGDNVSATTIIYPYFLPKIHASLFTLYSLHCKKNDDEYWSRILKWNRHTDIALLSFLEVDEKFWFLESTFKSPVLDGGNGQRGQVRNAHFQEAVETLQQIKTKFTPLEKLTVVVETFRKINQTAATIEGKEHYWSMDELFPVFQYTMVRARIPQLGAEIMMIEDLIMKVDDYLCKGEYGIWFTTMTGSYLQILKEPLNMSS